MTTSTMTEHFDAAARLRYVDQQIADFLDRRAREAARDTAAAAGRSAPAPHRVRVFLRGPGGSGHFGTLATTRPVVPRPRGA